MRRRLDSFDNSDVRSFLLSEGYGDHGYTDQSAMREISSAFETMTPDQVDLVTGALAHIFNNKVFAILNNLGVLRDDQQYDDEIVQESLEAARAISSAMKDIRRMGER